MCSAELGLFISRSNTEMVPFYKTRKIMRSTPDVEFVSSDSVSCMSKAAQLFTEEFVKLSCKNLQLSYNELSSTQQSVERYAFLSDVLPQKITYGYWLDKYKEDFEASL